MSEQREDWLVREQFRVVRVSSLPYAHGPWKCDHFALFQDDGQWDGVAGRRFFERLTNEQLRTCEYHTLADWKKVAATAVRLFRAHRDRSMSELNQALEQEDVNPQVWWLFHDPIIWGRKSRSVRNGQHRTCAIRASGARVCVIDHDRFDPYAPPP